MQTRSKIILVALAALVFWTSVILYLYVSAVRAEANRFREQAIAEARVAHEKDLTYRRWASRMGGLYVAVTDTLQPNPYLSVPNRDITTDTGKKLTLVNPAYMTRMVHTIMTEKSGQRGHITSLNPIRPQNAPDPWERSVLGQFTEAGQEIMEFTTLDGQPVLRLMRPMITEQSCLKCHEEQGYAVGDIRGGVSVTVPMASYNALISSFTLQATKSHALIWLMGVAGILFSTFTLLQREKARGAYATKLMRMQRLLDETQEIGMVGGWEHVPGSASTLWTDNLYRLLGYEPDEIDNPHDFFFTHVLAPEDRNRVWQLYEDAARDGQRRIFEFNVRHRNGEQRRFHSVMVPEADADTGEVLRVHGSNMDVTDLHRTQNLLLQAKDQAEAANRAKSEFLANMSHEIRTPLNGILGMLQLLETTARTKEQEEYCTMAVQSTRRLTRLLSDILDLTRVEAGKMPLRNEPMELRRALGQATELFDTEARQSDVDFKTDYGAGLPEWVRGDPVRLQQVCINLLGNAFKYTSLGRVSLSVQILPHAAPGWARLLFCVSDTGMGIPDDKLDSLFRPFTQASEGYTRQHQGAGLGLSICKRLVDLMGGSIAMESETGVGTSVYLSIPFELVDKPSPTLRAVPTEQATVAKMRILVAEDDDVSAVTASRILKKQGHEVTVAGSGLQALRALREGAYDIVLMDVQMPELDGVSATRAIRCGEAGEANRDVPIIAMTAYAMASDRDRFLNAGMTDYLPKPLELRTLHKLLTTHAPRPHPLAANN